MKFDTCQIKDAEGCILAHSVITHSKKIKKGKVLNPQDLEVIHNSGISEIMVARLEPGDLGEDEAAALLGNKITTEEPSLFASTPFTGRVNIYSSQEGLLKFDSKRITAFNMVDEAITLATLPNLAKVEKNQLIGTVKIIPYGVSRTKVLQAASLLENVIEFKKVIIKQADLIITTHTGGKDKLSDKSVEVTKARLKGLGITLEQVFFEPHDAHSLGKSLQNTKAPLVLVMTSTATSDQNDTGPLALRLAGGKVARVGIPVDPGNLLFYGELGFQKVIGLPGCARSPALNGADWVLERIACGIDLSPEDFAAMGTGGLLKEIPIRRQPRDRRRSGPLKPDIQVILMGDSKAKNFDSQFSNIMAAQIDGLSIVGDICEDKIVKFTNLKQVRLVQIHGSPGKSNLIARAMVSLPRKTDAVIFINLHNEVIITSDRINQLISAFSPEDGREICKFGGVNVPMGPPILFGRRFFENLRLLDRGLRPNDLIKEGGDYLIELD